MGKLAIIVALIIMLMANPVIAHQPNSVDIIVAAYDASARAKAGASYICDGQNDEVELLLAIQEAAISNDNIRLVGRTFNISLVAADNNYVKLPLPSHTTFDLGGATIRVVNADPNPGGHYNYTVIGPGPWATDVIIRNGTIDGNKTVIDPTALEYLVSDADATSDGVTLENLHLINSTRQAILPRGYNWQITNLHTSGNGVFAIIGQFIHGLNIENWESENESGFTVEGNSPGDNEDINITNWRVRNPGPWVMRVGDPNQYLDILNVSNVIVRDAGIYGIIQGALATNSNFSNITILRKAGVNTMGMVTHNAEVTNVRIVGYIGFSGSNSRLTDVYVNADYHFIGVQDFIVVASEFENNYRNAYQSHNMLFVANKFNVADPVDAESTGIVYEHNLPR